MIELFNLLTDDWKLIVLAIFSAYSGLVALASAIAKITNNETANVWVARLHKINDFIAMSTGKTELKGKLDV